MIQASRTEMVNDFRLTLHLRCSGDFATEMVIAFAPFWHLVAAQKLAQPPSRTK
jgi:hypothetical protein